MRNSPKGEQWTFRPEQTITLDFGYEVVEPLESIGLLLTVATAGTGEVITTSVKEVLSVQQCQPGKSDVFSVAFPNNSFRPGEFVRMACLGNADFSAIEDIIDSNVNLPHHSIESEEEASHLRLDYFSIDYSVSYE